MINWKQGVAPEPPFIASIFNYYLSDQLAGYEAYDELTLKLAMEMPGYLGYESFKHDGRGAFISYWKDMDAVRAWASESKHIEAKKKGQSTWYRYYHSIIAEVQSLQARGI